MSRHDSTWIHATAAATWSGPRFNFYHQYAQHDFTLVDRRLGTLQELRATGPRHSFFRESASPRTSRMRPMLEGCMSLWRPGWPKCSLLYAHWQPRMWL